MVSSGAAGGASSIRPPASCTRTMIRGVATAPPFANAVYAATISIGRTALAPIALDGYGRDRRVDAEPLRERDHRIHARPAGPSCTATVFRDRTSASRSVSGPRNSPSELSGA